MNNQSTDMYQESDMPTAFEELEVRRALSKTHIEEPDVNTEWAKFVRSLEDDSKTPTSDIDTEELSKKGGHNKLFLAFWSGVAAAVLVFFILYPFFRKPSSIEVFTANENKQNVVVKSDDGQLAVVKDTQSLAFNQPKSSTAKSFFHQVKMLELSTPRGKDCKAILPDGTQVWLNADSKISFPDKFVGKERNVRVEGEVFFQVTKDALRPFIVTTDYFTTTVHGTSFNVKAYATKTASVTLVTGSVAVKSFNGKETMMTPGQMAVCDEQGNTHVREVDTYPLIQWKDGFFYFDNERLVDIMMELGRWYNVSIVFEHEEDMNLRLHFVAEHTEDLRDIVRRINALGVAKLKLEKDCIAIE